MLFVYKLYGQSVQFLFTVQSIDEGYEKIKLSHVRHTEKGVNVKIEYRIENFNADIVQTIKESELT